MRLVTMLLMVVFQVHQPKGQRKFLCSVKNLGMKPWETVVPREEHNSCFSIRLVRLGGHLCSHVSMVVESGDGGNGGLSQGRKDDRVILAKG